MARRIFVAIGISEQLQNEIMAWEDGYRSWPVRWLQGKNLHVTLIPPWYVEDTRTVTDALSVFAKEKPCAPFALHFTEVTFGPDPRRPRLIWASGETPPELSTFKSGIEQAFGQESERRDFKLHLTLARFREDDFPAFPITTLDEKVVWEESIESFVLMESHLSRSGAEYEILARYAFTEPQS